MSHTPAGNDSGRAGRLIAGLIAIPFLSVTSAALVADVAAATDPAAALVGIPAVLSGVLMAGLVFRLGRALHSGAVAVCGALLRTLERQLFVIEARTERVPSLGTARPTLVFIPASVGRRGPPNSSR